VFKSKYDLTEKAGVGPMILHTRSSICLTDSPSELEEIAGRLDVTPEDLARVSIEELLALPEETFRQAAEYVLRKNAELYNRLA